MRLLNNLLAAATIAVAFPVSVEAQHHCSGLSIQGTGHPGTHLTFTLSHAQVFAPAILFIASHTGYTVLNFGSLGSLELGVAEPLLLMVPLGITTQHGVASITATVPLHIPPMALNAQGTTMLIAHGPPRFMFCTSNVAPFRVGAHH